MGPRGVTSGTPGVVLALDVGASTRAATAAEAARRATAADPELSVLLVVPPGGEPPATEPAPGPRVDVVRATATLPDHRIDPAHAVRSTRGASVRVAARHVRDGRADLLVSMSGAPAAHAAAAFTFRLLPGVTAPSLAAVVVVGARALVLLDTGGVRHTPSADATAQLALAGSALARVRLGRPDPAVAVLTGLDVTADDRAAVDALAGLPLAVHGAVSAREVASGRAPDVVVTDARSGAVLLGALTSSAVTEQVVLGLDAPAVVVGGDPDAAELARVLQVAASLARADVVAAVRSATAPLVDRRRAAAGLPATGLPAARR